MESQTGIPELILEHHIRQKVTSSFSLPFCCPQTDPGRHLHSMGNSVLFWDSLGGLTGNLEETFLHLQNVFKAAS